MDFKRKLLGLIKSHEVLYNTNLPEYKDIVSRNEAWNLISENMDMSVEDCKTEWVKLRNCYVNALRRRVSLQNRSGKVLPPWIMESEMSFLKPFMTGRGWEDTPYTVLLPDHTFNIDHDSTIESIIVKEESDTEQIIEKKKNKSNRNEEYKILETNEVYKAKSSYQDSINEMDDSDLFFLGLSQTFKTLPKVEQCRLKMDIFKIVNDAEMKHLERASKKVAKRRCSSTE